MVLQVTSEGLICNLLNVSDQCDCVFDERQRPSLQTKAGDIAAEREDRVRNKFGPSPASSRISPGRPHKRRQVKREKPKRQIIRED